LKNKTTKKQKPHDSESR